MKALRHEKAKKSNHSPSLSCYYPQLSEFGIHPHYHALSNASFMDPLMQREIIRIIETLLIPEGS